MQVELLAAGAVRLEHATLPILEDDILGGADGMLGVETMTDMRLELDASAQTLTASNSAAAAMADHCQRIPVRLAFVNLALASGKADGVPVTFIIETGAERSIANEALA